MSDTTSLAIQAWLETTKLADERADLMNDQARRLALVLAELRRDGHAEQVDALMAKHKMTVQWDVLWALYGDSAPAGDTDA